MLIIIVRYVRDPDGAGVVSFVTHIVRKGYARAHAHTLHINTGAAV